MKRKSINLICLATVVSLSLSLFPEKILAGSSVLPETISNDIENIEKADSDIKNVFNGCKESPVKLSITCNENDEFVFECNDGCGMKNEYTGYSFIQTGGFSSYSKNYEFIFETSGEHTISVYKNGNLIENDKIIIEENHSWDSGKVETTPTCSKSGKRKYTCSNCKNSYEAEIPAIGHDYIGKITKKAICTSDGIKTYTCSNCRDSYKEKIPAIGHDYIGKIFQKETCESNGAIKYICSNCRDSYMETIPKTGIHSWSEWKADGFLCADGKYLRECIECHEKETKSREGSGEHRYSEWHVEKNASCLHQGKKYRVCLDCHSFEYGDIPSSPDLHNWSDWITSKRPTALKNGKKSRKCYVCHLKRTKVLSKLKANITLTSKKKTLSAGKSFTLKLKKCTYGDKILKFSCSNKKIATVNSKGRVAAKMRGKAKVTVKMKSGCKATCLVIVY